MIIQLKAKEILEFQYILPIQGDLFTLELVEKISEKLLISNKIDLEENRTKDVDFENEEIELILNMINILDKNQQIRYSSLSLVRKFLKIKGDSNDV